MRATSPTRTSPPRPASASGSENRRSPATRTSQSRRDHPGGFAIGERLLEGHGRASPGQGLRLFILTGPRFEGAGAQSGHASPHCVRSDRDSGQSKRICRFGAWNRYDRLRPIPLPDSIASSGCALYVSMPRLALLIGRKQRHIRIVFTICDFNKLFRSIYVQRHQRV
jgi:hypothetical protein